MNREGKNFGKISDYGLENHGLHNPGNVYWNLPTSVLYEEVLKRGEGQMAHLGPLIVRTGQFTGRSPKDKFIVEEAVHQDKVAWGPINQPISEEHFGLLHQRIRSYLQGRDIFVQDCFAGAHPTYKMPVRVITQRAWHNLFVRNMFIQAKPGELDDHVPLFTVIDAPACVAMPSIDGTRSETFVAVSFEKRLILVGGTEYAGEIKKSIFSVMNYLLPERGVLPMHCSANRGADDSVALFFGLSGTGKTTLSTDTSRTLIGDDEHGWGDDGVFNVEGGCYAKTIRLSADAEPDIYNATRRFGTILENVGLDPITRRVDLDDDTLTENTRAVYPVTHIPNATRSGMGGHPNNVIMLTADAYGVLPPVSKLTTNQAVYHFLSGYTAKVAGTERGVVDPEATFSACFGEPFMVLHPSVYAEMLAEKIGKYNADVWLINTGWSGGPFGVGKRINIRYTRAMVRAALDGTLARVETTLDPVFNLAVPVRCPSVPNEVLNPREVWPDTDAYDRQARKLADMFIENFTKFTDHVSPDVVASGPVLE